MTDKTDFQEVSGLRDIGEVLKKKREELSYTLEHISEVTCITPTNLRNLEEGNLDDLPGPVFVKGFIKNYARFLKIESDWMIEALDEDKVLNGQSSNDYPGGQPVMLGETDGKSKGKYIWGVILLVLVLGAFFLWSGKIASYFSGDKETLETINAVNGKDPNWGRILMAVGNGLFRGGLSISIRLQGTQVFLRGEPVPYNETELAKLMDQFEVNIEVDLNSGDFSATGWGCDLSEQYVRINADYST